MEWVLISYFFIIGLLLGSFYNVVGIRVPNNESIMNPPRSYCPTCKRNLTLIDLIPVFSYLFLRGKCRGCQKKISALYPLIEFSTGVLFVLAYWLLGWALELIVALVFISLLIIIFISDIRYMIIPDKVLLFFAPIILVLRLFVAPLSPWWDALLGAVVGFGILLLIAVVSRGGMGGGDIKLYGVLGLVLGVKGVLLSLFFASFFGAIFGLVGMLAGRVKRGKPIPFGPYIVLGSLTAYFWGESILAWYVQLFS